MIKLNVLAYKVKNRRIALGLTQEQLAKRAGVNSLTLVSNIERGLEVSRPVLKKVLFCLNIEVEYETFFADEKGSVKEENGKRRQGR